jgi:hypothetical protein
MGLPSSYMRSAAGVDWNCVMLAYEKSTSLPFTGLSGLASSSGPGRSLAKDATMAAAAVATAAVAAAAGPSSIPGEHKGSEDGTRVVLAACFAVGGEGGHRQGRLRAAEEGRCFRPPRRR